MITDRMVDQAFEELRKSCGGIREDYFGLLYLEREHQVPRERSVNQVAFGGHDYGIDGFHFDAARRNLYLFQFKYSSAYGQFKGSLQRLIQDGMERIFAAPNRDESKNQMLLQLRSCLHENKSVIDQICIRFVFTGDPNEADKSQTLDSLRETLESKKYLVDQFFGGLDVALALEFRSSSGKVGGLSVPKHTVVFDLNLQNLVVLSGPDAQQLHVGMIRLADLHKMHRALGPRFFDRNIRFGLGQSKAVNRAISKSLKQIIVDEAEDPSVFAFNHNGITLYAERIEPEEGQFRITSPRLLNGAQTVTTTSEFVEENWLHIELPQGKWLFEEIRVLCRILTQATPKFVTSVTINNNRQNPVEPWNLHANDEIQLELQDKFRDDLGIYYERQEKAFDQLSNEELEESGILPESKPVQMRPLAQTFLLTDGQLSKSSELRRVFEDDKYYEKVFRRARLKANTRYILLCYKVHFRLKKLADDIVSLGQHKYAFLPRCRNLLWALICQGILNLEDLEFMADAYGSSMSLSNGFMEELSKIATSRVRPLLGKLLEDPNYSLRIQEGDYGFLRTDKAFDRCMEIANERWGWTHHRLQ